MTRRTLIATLVLLLLPAAVAAQRAATEKQGFNAQGVYQLSGLDSVSLFNGSLVVTIPIGPSYPVSPTLSFQLRAVYGSNAGWDHVTCPEGTFMPEVDKNKTAGFAWTITPGGHVTPNEPGEPAPWYYESGDGGRHGLYPTLHRDQPPVPSSTTFYSNDSSYLRMVRDSTGLLCLGPTGVTSECLLVEMPNGNVHEHRKVRATDEIYRVTRMRDRFGNYIDVSYGDTTWTVSDSEGRSHTIRFAGPAGEYNRVNKVDLAAFNGGVATYVLQYDFKGIQRRDFNPAGCSLDDDQWVSVHLLDRLVLPDDSYYEFDYYVNNSSPDWLPGGLKSLRLPTGGEYRWKYGRFVYSSQIPERAMDRDVSTVYAVVEKQTALTAGGTAVGTWSYDYRKSADYGPGDGGPVFCHRETVVTDPLGNDSVHYFSTTNTNKHLWAYGLGMTYCAPGVGYSATGPFLSSEVYQGSRATGTKLRSVYVGYGSDGASLGGGWMNQEKNHRLVYQKTVFHDDGDKYKEVTNADFDGLGNFRQVAAAGDLSGQDDQAVTVDYNADAGTLVVDPDTGSTTGSDFVMPSLSDPWVLGTFSTRQVTAAGDTATSEYCFDTSTGYLERTRVLAGTSRAANDLLTVFEPEKIGGTSTGRVAVEKLYGGDDQTSMDGTYTSLCDMTLPAEPKYETHHTYSSGVRATSTAIDPCDSRELLRLADLTIDANTGLVRKSRDAAGVETVFVYDTLGRLTSQRPADTAWTSYAYQLPTQASPSLLPVVTIKDCPNGQTTCSDAALLTWQRFDYDALGRAVKERIRLPTTTGLVDNVKTTEYNALGWKTSESVWGNASKVTTFDQFDPFGRVGRITPPGQTAVTFTYQGERVKTRKVKIMMASGVQEFAYTTELYDAHGRLRRVCEDMAATWSDDDGCTGIETTYLHDVGGRLTRVCLGRQSDDTCGQIRRFVYDHRGFLTQERHPEIGITEAAGAFQGTEIVDPDGFTEIEALDAGNDWTYYTYDARGNVLTKRLEGSTDFDLDYFYDGAGRLIRVEENRGGNPRPLKDFFYGYENSGVDMRKGKLVQARRHNWIRKVAPIAALIIDLDKDEDALITEVFKYEGRDGRVSARQTRYHFRDETTAFNLSQTYDDLGNVNALTYPQCVQAQDGCSGATPSRTVTYQYTKGFLTSVPGYATNITYQAGGMLHQITHANGVVDTMAIDASNGLERPYQISTTAGWDTGTYAYDGAGNIHRIGTENFRYDRMSRLVSGQVKVGTSLRTQTAAFDVYGNITSLTTNGSVQSTPTDPATNRLQSPLADYDGGGNATVLDYGAERYEYTYDGANMMKYLKSDTGLARTFLYSADDERIIQLDCVTSACSASELKRTWTLRGTGAEVLRTYTQVPGREWTWEKDYIHRGGTSLASVDADGVLHLHPDHLGTPRQITRSGGGQESLHSYYPFGQEATGVAQDDIALKFTGHERDSNDGRSKGRLDYMHARLCSPTLGRFLETDPINTAKANRPQSTNKYNYALNNPLKYIDSDGESVVVVLEEPDYERNARIRQENLKNISSNFPFKVIGDAVAGAFDALVMSRLFPSSRQEVAESGNADIMGMVVPLGSAPARLSESFLSSNSGKGVRVINSKLGHAAERAVERAGFTTEREAADALRALGQRISKEGVPASAVADTAHPDRILISFGNGGAAVYQITKTGTLRLRTVLKFIEEKVPE